MKKKEHNLHSLVLVLILFVSPLVWVVLYDMPSSFALKGGWFYLSIFCLVAYAVFVALTSHKDN